MRGLWDFWQSDRGVRVGEWFSGIWYTMARDLVGRDAFSESDSVSEMRSVQYDEMDSVR